VFVFSPRSTNHDFVLSKVALTKQKNGQGMCTLQLDLLLIICLYILLYCTPKSTFLKVF